MSSLNEPYGGRLVERIDSARNPAYDNLPVLTVSEVVESDCINIATGILSPLSGFMGSDDFDSVCKRNRLAGSDLVWTIPVVMDVDEADLKSIGGSGLVKLVSRTSGAAVGVIEAGEVFPHDKETRILATFGTDSEEHPGVKLVRSMKPYLLAGAITAFKEALAKEPLSYPREVRERLSGMNLKTVAGFQTRNIVHRAHEYLQRIALEVCDGLLIHPIVGWKKSGDFKPEAVKGVYGKFIAEFYPEGKALLAFLNTAMRYAGPKEAVFHAIIRKNFGCSHFIVGRDHAGVGGFYDTYAAHRIFDSLPDLGIEILRLHGPFYCRKCAMIVTEQTCGHDESAHEHISGTKVRSILTRGVDPEGHFLRPEVLETVKQLQKNGSLFYE